MIYSIPTLSRADERVIETIDDLRGRLRSYLGPPTQLWTMPLLRRAKARTVHGSTAFEGHVTSLENVDALIKGETPPERTETLQAIQGTWDALNFALRVAEQWPAIDSTTIRVLHYMIMNHDRSALPGNWRSRSVFVQNHEGNVVYTGPDRNVLEGLIDELTAQLKMVGVPPLIKAAMAHLNLTLIHPFADGNGRTARCLQTFVLAKEDIREPVVLNTDEYLAQNTSAYYQALQETAQGEWSPERSAQPWIRFALTAHYHQAQLYLYRIEESALLWEQCQDLAIRDSLPERVTGALCDIAQKRRLRRSTYQKITKETTGASISVAVATRDLAAMVDKGLIVESGKGPGRYYQATPQLLDIRHRIRNLIGPPSKDDPYDLFGQSPLFDN